MTNNTDTGSVTDEVLVFGVVVVCCAYQCGHIDLISRSLSVLFFTPRHPEVKRGGRDCARLTSIRRSAGLNLLWSKDNMYMLIV